MSLAFDYFFGLPFYRYPYPNINYVLKTGAAGLPVTLDEIKAQARIDPTITSEDTYLTLLANASTTIAEDYMRRDLINKSYYAYMDFFPVNAQLGIQLTRSKLQSVTAIEYLVNGVYQTVSPSVYYFTDNADFSTIYLNNGQAWPGNFDVRSQAIRITFVAGYGATLSAVPNEIRMGVLNMITFMYQQRGDSGDAGFSSSIPELSLAIFDNYKIYSLGIKN